MSKKLTMIVNPCAGQRHGIQAMAEIRSLFCAAGYDVSLLETQKRGDGTEFALRDAAHSDCVVAVGGDGTLNEVITGMLRAGAQCPLGYIPAGTTNDFAGSLHLPRSPLAAARAVLNGVPTPLDVGRFGEHYFTYIASFGAFTRASYATPQNAKNLLGHFAYVLEGTKDISSIRPEHVRVETPTHVWEDDYLFGAITNSTSVGGMLTLDESRVDLSDGLFELLLIRYPRNPVELAECILALQTRDYNASCLSFCSAPRAHITASPEMEWTLDGEYEPGHAEADAENLHHAIRLLLPAR